MKNFPKHLVILGGGTAGWMAAAYLDRIYNSPGRRALPITVVESANMPRIGVGEATFPNLREMFSFLGLNETELMQRTGATLKHGIRFEDWSEKGKSYFHPFEGFSGFGDIPVGVLWLARQTRGVGGRFQDEAGMQSRLAESGFAPKSIMDDGYAGALNYGYHLDADRLGDYLAEVAMARGCRRIMADVTRVEEDSDGDIASLHSSDGQTIEGDFFVDCSGFSSVLLGKTLKEPFIDFKDYLLCDRAVTIRAPYAETARINPYTTATALDAGWMWRIGLRHREGLGYVYSSKHITPESAEAEMRRVSGVAADLPARHLTMKIGHYRQAWVKNCVAIGLANGFIEPLESTGIFLITRALNLLVQYFPICGVNASARKAFNDHITSHYNYIRDFIVLHYCVSKRRDTDFWRNVTMEGRIPDTLRDKLNIWSARPPMEEDLGGAYLPFRNVSWQYVLYGMEHVSQEAKAAAAYWVGNRDDHIALFDQSLNQARTHLPSHDFWLENSLPADSDQPHVNPEVSGR